MLILWEQQLQYALGPILNTRFLILLKTNVAQIERVSSPQIFCMDFEMTMLIAMQQLFPKARALDLQWWQCIQPTGRPCSALPLLPPQNVDDVHLQGIWMKSGMTLHRQHSNQLCWSI